jgi:succinate dehydrogenase / fumarate reductase iron-sulfur subunit
MKKKIKILRQENANSAAYYQIFLYELHSPTDTIATALTALNNQNDLFDIDGNVASKISWQCSCLQKKCGACAMRINGTPRLACDAKLSDFVTDTIILEPFKKFPLVRDLIVDRSVMQENLKQLKVWLEGDASLQEKDLDDAQKASRCLQCGCCLEVCPNFMPEGSFKGLASAMMLTKLIMETPNGAKEEVYKKYKKSFYAGCSKAMSCHHICPAGIDSMHLMVKSNAIAVWKKQK